MKKIFYITLALVALASCSKDLAITNPSGEISFSAVAISRVSDTDDCQWKDDDQIGIFTNQTGESNMLYTISTGAISDKTLYTLSSGTRTYYAYHPYSSTQTSTTIATDYNQPLLWATVKESNDDEVELLFSHVLAKVKFNLTAGGNEVSSVVGAKVWLTGAYTTANFDIESGDFSNPATSILTLTLDNNNSVTLYLPPMQSVANNVQLWITAEDNTYLKTLTTNDWVSGYNYVYNITVGE